MSRPHEHALHASRQRAQVPLGQQKQVLTLMRRLTDVNYSASMLWFDIMRVLKFSTFKNSEFGD